MRYRNASDILPDRLLREIQKYTSGEAIYIPATEVPSGWGEKSGARAFYRSRNEAIAARYREGVSMDILAEEFCLSVESVRKIVYQMRK